MNLNYTAPIDYIVSSYIREYDISNANINILLYKNLISLDDYKIYSNLDRFKRQYTIGMLQRKDKTIAKELNDGFKEIMDLFIKSNNIKEYEILSIKKDAIYLINKIPNITSFSNIEFITKNTYTSFYKISKLEFYYFSSKINNLEQIDIKGINDEKIKLHENDFLEFLLILFETAENNINDSVDLITTYYNRYINHELDIGHYREFNSRSQFRLITDSRYSTFFADILDNDFSRSNINIYYNLNIIVELYKIFTRVIFQNK